MRFWNGKTINPKPMKRIIFLLMTAAICGNLVAQEKNATDKTSWFSNSSQFDLGISGGPGMITLRGNTYIDEHHKPAIGFATGITAQYNFPKIISVRAEFGFARKGSQLNEELTFTDANGNVIGTDRLIVQNQFDYLQVPLVIRASIGKKMKYFVNAGMYGGYLLNQTIITNQTDYSPAIDTDNTGNMERLDLGIVSGFGIEYPIGKRFAASCEIRNSYGLYNTSKVPLYQGGWIKTNSTNLLFNFVYRIGERG